MTNTTICFAFLLASATLYSQTPTTSDDLERVVFARTRAAIQGDCETYERLTAPTFLWTGPSGKSSIRTAKLTPRVPLEEAIFDLKDFTTLLVGQTAVVSYRLIQYENNEEGSPYYMTRRTETYVRTDTGWKLIAERETEVPDTL